MVSLKFRIQNLLLKALFWASLVAQLVKTTPIVWKTWVQSLGWKDPLEKEKATHSTILAWKIPWTVWVHKELDMTEWLSLIYKYVYTICVFINTCLTYVYNNIHKYLKWHLLSISCDKEFRNWKYSLCYQNL